LIFLFSKSAVLAQAYRRTKLPQIKCVITETPYIKFKLIKKNIVGASIGQFARLLRSLELRAVFHSTVLLLRDQKLLFRMRKRFEGSKKHLPTE